MSRLPVALLGISFASLKTEELVNAILKLAEDYRKDLMPRHVSWVDTTSIPQIYSSDFTSILYPELLHTLRQSDEIGTSSRALIWLSYALGAPIPFNTKKALFYKLVEQIEARKLSIFLVGENESSIKTISSFLQRHVPQLNIAGTSHGPIYVKGENLENAKERDALLLEQINRSVPDFLFIHLSSPKPELWFNRVRKQLHVPITIDMEENLEYSGFSKQNSKHWILNFFKLLFLAIPLLFFHHLNALMYRLTQSNRSIVKPPNPLLFISSTQAVALVQLPPLYDRQFCEELSISWEDLFSQDALILDFQHVRHLDSYAVSHLMKTIMRANREKKPFYIMGISGDIRLLLRLHRIWDMLRNFDCHSPDGVIARLNCESEPSSLYDSIQQDHGQVVIHFFGDLDLNQNYDSYLTKLAPVIYQKECLLDLTYCHYIDNSAFVFLLKLRENRQTQFRSLKLRNLTPSLKRQFDLVHASALFTIE